MKGYSNELYILAFDHRGTLTKGLLGVEGRPPNEEEASRVSSMTDIIFDGFIEAKETGIGTGEPAILVDETFGLQVQQKAKEMGVKFAAPVEKSGQKVFDFEYGDEFGEKIKEVNADFVKILVRWNPNDDEETREVQGKRIKTLSEITKFNEDPGLVYKAKYLESDLGRSDSTQNIIIATIIVIILTAYIVITRRNKSKVQS